MALDHRDISRMLEVAIVAARLAGQRAMEEIDFIKASLKNGDEMVTQTDERCQKIIIDRIKETFPDHGFIAEEGQAGKMFKQTPRGSDAIWWVIDPIDGTNNFARQILNFTVSIAAMHEGKPIIGVIFEPATDSMFTAAKDTPPQLNTKRIKANDAAIGIQEVVGMSNLFDKGVPNWAFELMGKARCRNLGSTALHLAYVAKGSFIAALTQKPGAKLWDIAAGCLIAESAGAIVTGLDSKSLFPMDLKKYDADPITMVAANKKVHAEILKTIN